MAIITGSTTSGASAAARTAEMTASMMATSASMPVFAATGSRSSTTAPICLATSSGPTVWMPNTPRVFWAVTAVIADAPKTPNAWKVFRSA